MEKQPVTRYALVQRVKRALAKEGKTLAGRGELSIIDLKKKGVIESGVDLVKLAKSLDVMKPYETLGATKRPRY